MALGTWLWLAAALGVALAFVVGWPRRRRRRNGLRALAGLVLLGLAAFALLGGLLLRQYHRLRDGVPVAHVALRQLGPQSFEATLEAGGDLPVTVPLHGDEWQLDARVVHWRLPGLASMYRLERLSGRYGDPKQDATAPRDAHDLRAPWDFWQFRQRWLADVPIADASWGRVEFLPMLDGTRFAVYFDAEGRLMAKPADADTERRLREAGW